MLLITSARFEDHIPPPGHPERPERAHVFDAVASRWREKGRKTAEPAPTGRDTLQRVHDAEYLDGIERTAGQAVMLDPDTFTSSDSQSVALLAAGAAVHAAAHAVSHGEPAFALVRPPGHHAERNRAMGFCLYNNVAVAASAMRAQGVDRIAIVDIDVHHGNGTQWMFYDDPTVLYVSTHQFPFYPGTGAASEIGTGAGRGFTVNVPLEAGATDDDYQRVYDAIVLPVLAQFSPRLTLVSAGYDAHERDPLASMRVTTAGYAAIVRMLAEAAMQYGSLALVTEGGYELTALAECLEASFAALDTTADGSGERATGDRRAHTSPRAERAIAAVRAAQSSHWRGL